jgi:hypothetical protein
MFEIFILDKKVERRKPTLHSWNFFKNVMIMNIKIQNILDIIGFLKI